MARQGIDDLLCHATGRRREGGFGRRPEFPFSTASWYFLDALDMAGPEDTRVVVALGDSITDGTASTMNGDDRWPDVLLQRLHAQGNHIAVVDAGIGGNQVIGPASTRRRSRPPAALRRSTVWTAMFSACPE